MLDATATLSLVLGAGNIVLAGLLLLVHRAAEATRPGRTWALAKFLEGFGFLLVSAVPLETLVAAAPAGATLLLAGFAAELAAAWRYLGFKGGLRWAAALAGATIVIAWIAFFGQFAPEHRVALYNLSVAGIFGSVGSGYMARWRRSSSVGRVVGLSYVVIAAFTVVRGAHAELGDASAGLAGISLRTIAFGAQYLFLLFNGFGFLILAREETEQRLRDSRERLARAQRVGRVGSAQIGLNGGPVIWSDEYFRILGLDPVAATASAETIVSATHPDDRAMVEDVLARMHAGVETPTIDFRVVRPDDSVAWVRRHQEFECDNHGNRVAAIVTLQDITGQVALETELRRRQDNLVRAQRMGRIGSVEIDMATQKAIWSDELYEIYGRDPALGPADLETFLAFIHPADRDQVAEIRAQQQKGVVAGPNEFRIVRPDGAVRWIHRELELQRDRNGKPVTLYTTEQDVTERRRVEAELRASEERYRRLIDSVTEYSICALDPEGIVTDWNSGAQRINGYAADEIIGRHFSIFYTAEDRAAGRADRALQEAISTGKYERVGERLRKDGTRFWANVVISPIFDEAMALRGFSKVTRDISERVAFENELRRKEEHLVRAQRVGMIGSVEVDLVHGLEIWSDGLFTLLGLDPATNAPSLEAGLRAVHPDDRALIKASFERSLAGKTEAPMAVRVLRPDGELRWALRQSEIERDAAGRPARLVTTYQDITERRRLEIELRRSRDRLVFAQRMARIGSMEFDLRSGQAVRSDEYYHVLGIDPAGAPVEFERIIAAFHPEDRAVIEDAARRMREGLPVPSLELRVPRRDGETVWVRRDQGFIDGPDGQHELAVVTLLDITDQKRLERQKDEFVSTVSHELRTPLTSIRGALGLLEANHVATSAEKTRRLIEIALRNSERLARLVDDLLDIQRIQAGRMVYRMTDIAVAPLVRDAIETTRPIASQNGIDIAFDTDCPEAYIHGDAERMVQVMANLLSNAIKFSKSGQQIEVRVARRPPRIRITVQDHGEGIPDSFRGRIFQRFAQSEATDARKRGGSGLGLSIVEAIVSHHRGEITFETELGAGTSFHVDLVEVEPPQAAPAATEQTTASAG